MQHPSFVPAPVLRHRAQREIARAATVDFAVHPERFGEVDDLETGTDAADIHHAGARDVAGAIHFGQAPACRR